MIEKKIKLLVVEDNQQIRFLMRMTFKRQPQVELFEAINGADGFKLFQEVHPDLVFSDVNMPGEMDGISLCRHIKASNHPCPVVLISANSQQHEIDLGMQAGADLYKIKPVGPKELIDLVKTLSA
jgi:DNA-binding response OmpR family regulator